MKVGPKSILFNEDTSDIDDSFICGENCVIHSHVTIGKNVIFGDNVSVGAFSLIADNTVVESNVRIDHDVQIVKEKEEDIPNIVRKIYKKQFVYTHIESGVKIDARTNILVGVKIGKNSRVGAESFVVEDVPENVVVCGEPAVIHNKIGF